MKTVMAEYMVPRFKQNDYSGGIVVGADNNASYGGYSSGDSYSSGGGGGSFDGGFSSGDGASGDW